MKEYMKTVYNIASKVIMPVIATGMALGMVGCDGKADKIGRYDRKQVEAIYKQLDEAEAQCRTIDKYCFEVADPLLAQAEADRKIDEAVKRGEMPKGIQDKTLNEIIEDGFNQPAQSGDDEILRLYGIDPK